MSDTTSTRPVRRTSVDAAAVSQQDRHVEAYNKAFDRAAGYYTAITGIELHRTAELNMLSQLAELLAAFEAAALTPEGQQRLFVNHALLGFMNGNDSVRDLINETAEKLHFAPAYFAQLVSNIFGRLENKDEEIRSEIITAMLRLVSGELGNTRAGGRLEVEYDNQRLQDQLRNALNAPALPAPKVDTSRISDLESQLAAANRRNEELQQRLNAAATDQQTAVDKAVRNAVNEAVNAGSVYTQAQLDAAVKAANQAGQRDKDAAVRTATDNAVNDAVRKGEVIRKGDHDTAVRDSVRAARQDIDDQIHSAVATVYRQIASNVVPKDRRKGFFLNDDDIIITTGDDATPESKVLLKVVNDPSADIPRPASSPASTSTQSDTRPVPGPGPRTPRRASAPAGSPGSQR